MPDKQEYIVERFNGFEWIECKLKDIRLGDRFRLKNPEDGVYVNDSEVFLAHRDAYWDEDQSGWTVLISEPND